MTTRDRICGRQERPASEPSVHCVAEDEPLWRRQKDDDGNFWWCRRDHFWFYEATGTHEKPGDGKAPTGSVPCKMSQSPAENTRHLSSLSDDYRECSEDEALVFQRQCSEDEALAFRRHLASQSGDYRECSEDEALAFHRHLASQSDDYRECSEDEALAFRRHLASQSDDCRECSEDGALAFRRHLASLSDEYREDSEDEALAFRIEDDVLNFLQEVEDADDIDFSVKRSRCRASSLSSRSDSSLSEGSSEEVRVGTETYIDESGELRSKGSNVVGLTDYINLPVNQFGIRLSPATINHTAGRRSKCRKCAFYNSFSFKMGKMCKNGALCDFCHESHGRFIHRIR